MILSKKHNFLYIKGRKVASTSMEVFLTQFCSKINGDIVTPITPIDEKKRLTLLSKGAMNCAEKDNELLTYLGHLKRNINVEDIKIPKCNYYNHISYSELLKNNTLDLQSPYIFAIDRNPYTKIISHANMKLNFANYKKHGKPMTSDINDLKKSLKESVRDGSIVNVKNIDLYKDLDGNIATDIYKCEDINSEIEKIVHKLNLDVKHELPHYKEGGSSKSIPISEILNHNEIEKVNDIFEEEFEAFGYEKL